jgi:Spy/CpxP family protein refolding chaperone
MNRVLKWKLIAGFLLVFVAGAMTGAFFGASHARHLFLGPNSKELSERMRNRLRWQLHLTDEQVAKITPIVDKAAAELKEIRKSTGRRVHETIAEAHREMAADLTPEQRAKLQEVESRHQRWRGFHKARSSPTGTPGG